uniref:Uncharacterized protein n=1 Tax=Glossina brevipalpis TaxID=37001 RepID=A0A1A9WFC6_9MUSC
MPPLLDESETDIVRRKCGDIMITIKKNTKKVFEFNCFFCDTVCLQMKKFTSHLEQEHDKQLETNRDVSDLNKNNSTIDDDNKDNNENKAAVDNINKIANDNGDTNVDNSGISIFIPEVKLENCLEEDGKTENFDKHRVTRNTKKKELTLISADPLDTFNSQVGEETIATIKKELEKARKSFTKSKHKNKKDLIQLTENNENDQDTKTAYCSDDNYDDIYNGQLSNENSIHSSDGDNNLRESDFEVNVIKFFLKGMDLTINILFLCKSEDEPVTFKRSRKRKPPKEDDPRVVSVLIDLFKPHEFLWNSRHSKYNDIQLKRDTLQSITDELNERFKAKLKLEIVRRQINVLRRDYAEEIEKRMDCLLQQEETSCLWYYDKMEFLKPIIEYKLKNRSKALSESVLSQLTDIYKNYNTLWDVNHLAFTIKEKRQETLEFLQKEVKQIMGLDLSTFRLEKQLNHIHKAYAKDKRRKLESEADDKEFKAHCGYFNKCDFLSNNQGPFRCSSCQVLIETYNDFQIHKSQHDNSMPFKCPECGLGFKKINNFTVHAKRHLKVFKYRCNICDKGYPFSAELDLHMRSHTGAMPYLCSKCGEAFRTAIGYDNHIRRHEERFKYFCHICKRGFNHMTRLNDHVKAHLNVRDVICPVCGKGFTTRKYLNHHRRIHEAKRYTCDICGKKFAQDAGLRAHKKYHIRRPIAGNVLDQYHCLEME